VSVVAAVDKMLEALTLDDLGETRAEIARALAEQLDAVTASASGAAAMAGAAVARELRATLDEILEGQLEDDPLLAALMDKGTP